MLEKLYARVLYGLLGMTGPLLCASSYARTPAPSSETDVRVESADAGAVHLRFSCESPRLDRVGVGDQELPALALDGTGFLYEAGYPLVPRRRVLVEIPPGVEVLLTTVQELEEPLGPVPLAPAPRRTVDATSGEVILQTVLFADSRTTLPAAPIRLEYVGWLRHRRVACLEYTPVRFDPVTGEASVSRELRVVLQFTALASAHEAGPVAVVDSPWFDSLYRRALVNPGTYYATATSSNSRRGPAATAGPLQPAAIATDVRWRLKVEAEERGLYEITPADLQAAGIDPAGVDPHRIGMSRRGTAIAIDVEGESDGSFDTGDRVLFYADVDSDKYRDVNAWWIFELLAGPGAGAHTVQRMQQVDGAPQPGNTPVPFFRETVRAEESQKYWQTRPTGTEHDHWFWRRKNAPAVNDYPIWVPHPEPGGSNLRVRAALHGFTDTVQNPDHHTRVYLNGTQVDDATWNGMIPFEHDVSVSSSLLLAGSNTIRLQQDLDLGANVAGCYSDWFEVDYDRDFVAEGDELLWSHDSAQVETFEALGFTSPSVHAFVVTDPAGVARIVNAQIDQPSSYRVTFQHLPAGEPNYFLAAEPAIGAPLSISPGRDPIPVPPEGADLLIVAGDQFAAALAPLVQQREQAGLRVTRVDPQEIYDEYNHGEFDPEAIQAFVQNAFLNWPAPAPSFLLLVGEASFDYRDHWGNGFWNSAPGYLYQSDEDSELPTDHFYATVAGGDVLPDLHVGRLPAANPTEAITLVGKILDYENAPPAGGWQAEVVHIADFGGQFISALNVAATNVPPTHTVTDVFADYYGSGGATHAAIMTELGEGCAIGTYFGHGAVYNWGQYLFDTGDVGGLANGDKLALIISLNCLNGFFAIYNPPNSPPRCLAEELLLAPSGGAVACIAPSGWGATWEYQRVLGYLYTRVFAGESLGEVRSGAMVSAYLYDAINVDNLWSCLLFGDPSGHLILPP